MYLNSINLMQLFWLLNHIWMIESRVGCSVYLGQYTNLGVTLGNYLRSIYLSVSQGYTLKLWFWGNSSVYYSLRSLSVIAEGHILGLTKAILLGKPLGWFVWYTLPILNIIAGVYRATGSCYVNFYRAYSGVAESSRQF